MSPGPRLPPPTCQPSASRRSATARPMPELLPVTTARRASFGTDLPLGDDLLRLGHVITLELDEIVHGAATDQQSLAHELVAHVRVQRLVDLGIEPGDDFGRQLGGAPQAVPAVSIIPRPRLA